MTNDWNKLKQQVIDYKIPQYIEEFKVKSYDIKIYDNGLYDVCFIIDFFLEKNLLSIISRITIQLFFDGYIYYNIKLDEYNGISASIDNFEEFYNICAYLQYFDWSIYNHVINSSWFKNIGLMYKIHALYKRGL